MKAIYTTTALLVLFTVNVMAKRLAPIEVPPVTTKDAVISAPHFPQGERTQNGGFLEARHPETKELLWKVQVYKTRYEANLEKDVQDVFIKSLTHDKVHKLLIIVDEESRIFVLNLKNKKVTPIE